ncbi:MAG: family 20 glycosylhydrolase [Rikenellaceae bacterium]
MKLEATLFLSLLSSVTLCGSLTASPNPKPFVIPELREWSGASGVFAIDDDTRIFLSSDDPGVVGAAEAFAVDYQKIFGEQIAIKKKAAQEGNITFELIDDSSLGEEGYTINIAENIEVRASSAKGLYWATRSMLQIADYDVDGELPRGAIKDYPDYEVRGFLLDCARKFIPLKYLENYIDILAYYKMNLLHIHLNDNGLNAIFDNDWNRNYSAFRLESEKFPGLTAQDGHYTKQEFIDLQILAESKHIQIVPEIDVPAHSLAFVRYKPELGSEYGPNYLDLFKPETYEFVDALFEEYIGGDDPVFRGEMVHIGTDEYKVAEEEHVREKFRYFADRYIKYVESFGKKAALWGSFTHMHGETEVKKSEDITMFIWNNPYGNPQEMIDDGYKIINIPESNYIVPTAPYYNDYLNIEKVYTEWTPAVVADITFEEQHPSIRGGMFALWNDRYGSGISLKDIHDRTMPAAQVVSAKCWSGANTTLTFDEFEEGRQQLIEAPGVNYAGRYGEPNSLIYEAAKVKPNSTTPFEEIGYDYTVSFDLKGLPEERGTVLFESDFAKFYLSDPINGMLGFSRDENLYHFRVSTFNKDGVNIMIQGDRYSTFIYVDGELIQSLDTVRRFVEAPEQKLKSLSTLVFPLAKTGDFKSEVTNLKVYNYKLN